MRIDVRLWHTDRITEKNIYLEILLKHEQLNNEIKLRKLPFALSSCSVSLSSIFSESDNSG